MPATIRDEAPDATRGGVLRGVLWLGFAVAAVGATIALAAWAGRPRPVKLATIEETKAGRDLDIDRIRALVRRLAGMKSRLTGYGADEAADILLEELDRIGIRSRQVQPFDVAVPVVQFAQLDAPAAGGGVSVRLHPLWPNLARTSQTPPAGVTGPLVHVGRGSDAELAGKQIADTILVIDWDCETEWLAAGEFGAKAVIFLGGDRGSGYTARSKFLTVPADIPRFYVDGADRRTVRGLAEAGAEATVRCRMAWRRATAKNILARVCEPADEHDPSDPDRQAIVFHAYYDSISVVPGLSPGAEQACGAAVAVELARYLAESPRKPSRPVWLLLTGGHGQALSGMTHFVGELRRGLADGWGDRADSLIARMGRPGLMIGLDISSRSERMGLFCAGRFRGESEGRLRSKFSDLGLILDNFAKERSAATVDAGLPTSFVDCINLTLGRGWWTYFPYAAPFESEIPTMSAFPAVTLSTLNDDRRTVDTPHDTIGRMRFDMLARQLRTRPGRRVGLANLAMALASWRGPFVSSALPDLWASVAGRVVWLDQQRDYTPSAPLPEAVVCVKAGRGDKFLMGTRGVPTVLADEAGRFEFDGLIKKAGWSDKREVIVEAYGTATEGFLRVNGRATAEYRQVVRRAGVGADRIEPDGSILFAADMARPKEYPWKVEILKATQHVNVVCFPCRSISLFAMTDPREYIDLSDLKILDVATRSPPFQYGRSITDLSFGRPVENCITLWADPTLHVRLTFGLGFQTKRLVLINNDASDPIGSGFVLKDLGSIPSMVLKGASDMWRLDQWRIEKLKVHGIGNPRVRQIHEEARGYLDVARKALARRDYQGYRRASGNGWALESKVYGELLDMTNNMIRGVLFYLAVLIPFSYCLERLLLAGGTIRKRIIGMVSIFVASFIVLAIAHPAFRFTMTPLIVLLAFVILALAVTVSLLVVGKFDRMLRERKQALTGLHEDIRSVGRIAVHAIDLGIANIRRRPRRGTLTAVTIVLVTFTLLSFTSIIPELNISKLEHGEGNPKAYKGLMVRSRNWAPLPVPLYDSLRRTYVADAHAAAGEADSPVAGGSAVAGRAWFFSDATGNLSRIDLSAARRGRPVGEAEAEAPGHFTTVALMCMEHTEPAVTGIDKCLVAGRWFTDANDVGVILPAHVAKFLGFGPGDLGKGVMLFGERLPLIGLIDAGRLDEIRDVDGEPITPVNFVLQEQMQAERADEEVADTLEEYVHYASHELAIIPLEYGRRLGASYRSIAVKTAASMTPDEEADRFARRSNVTILANDGERVTVHAAVESAKLSAAGQIVVPTLLGFVMVLGTMLGSVYERRREIFVYNSVGLSPANVSSLFLAESSVYAILGASMGYLLGQAISRVLLTAGLLSGLNLNYSAGAAVFVTVLTMMIVLLSTLYPARQAFLAAVPESHRAGGMGEGQATADRIDMYMPFVATPNSILGMQAYMYEFLDSVQGVTVGQLAVDDLAANIERGEGGREQPVLSFRGWLAPFDLGVSHDVELRVVYRADRGVWQYHLTAERFSGDQQNWRRLTPRFLLAVRKQLLMWRILSGEAIADYVRHGRTLFGTAEPGSEADE